MVSMEGIVAHEQWEMKKVASRKALSLSECHREVLSGAKAPLSGLAMKRVQRTRSTKAKPAKKDGAGYMGSWAKPISSVAESRIRCNDLNYGTCEESYKLSWSLAYSIDEYKKNVASVIEEYFSTGYVDVAASNLKKLGSSQFLSYFVERLVSMAMDQDDMQKEMASVLLSALSVYAISSAQITQGFLMLLESADDLALDNLDAVAVLALFLARAVHDDVLPLAFLSTAKKSLARSSKGLEVIHTAEKDYLSVQHHTELVEILDHRALSTIPSAETSYEPLVPKAISDGWLYDSLLKSSKAKEAGESAQNGSDDDNLKYYNEAMVTITQDYFLSGNIPEFTRNLIDLGLPEYNRVFFKKLVTLAMERTNREKEMASVLISSLYSECLSTDEDIVDGFILLLRSAEDTTLVPSNGLGLFLARAVTDHVLTPEKLEHIGKKLTPNSSGSKTVHMAQSLIAAKHACIRLCWGGGLV